MENVYLWKVGNTVIQHTNLQEAARLNNLSSSPHKTITKAEWEAAGGLVRIINNKIFLGMTNNEKEAQEKQDRINEIDAELSTLDQKYLTPRVLAGLANGNDNYAATQFNAHEELAEPLRSERQGLVQ
jgi:bifunctional N-acetylglucosamine-1-phosphate-uridyltransferase/glucosamine-1-phosphate-acetyltransferase GlmU-like protein